MWLDRDRKGRRLLQFTDTECDALEIDVSRVDKGFRALVNQGQIEVPGCGEQILIQVFVEIQK